MSRLPLSLYNEEGSKMRTTRHTEEERKAVVERVRISGRAIAEIAAEEGVSRQTIQSWMRAAPNHRASFIELPAPRATVVELRFPDGVTQRMSCVLVESGRFPLSRSSLIGLAWSLPILRFCHHRRSRRRLRTRFNVGIRSLCIFLTLLCR